jgi:hypothetical protein
MRRYGELSKDQELLLPLQFCSDCITATRGYDFWEGQGASQVQKDAPPDHWFDRLSRANPMLFAHWQLCHGNGRTSGAV